MISGGDRRAAQRFWSTRILETTMTIPTRRLIVATAILSACLPALAQDIFRLPGLDIERPVHALGVEVRTGETPAQLLPPAEAGDESATPGAGPWSLVEVAFSEISGDGWELDLQRVDEALSRVENAPGPVILAIRAGHSSLGRWGSQGFEAPAGQDPERALEDFRRAWVDMLRALARRAGTRVDWYLVDGLLPRAGSPGATRETQFEIKSTTVTLRAESRGVGVAFRLDGESELGLLVNAYSEFDDLAPYVDGVSLAISHETSARASAGTLRSALRDLDPGATLWLESEAPAGELDAEVAAARAAELMSSGADLGFVDFARDAEGALTGAALLGVLVRELGPGQGLTRPDDVSLAPSSAGRGISWARFFDADAFQETIVYWSEGPVQEGAEAAFVFDKLLRRGYEVLEIDTGRERLLRSRPVDDDRVEVRAPLSRAPRLLRVKRQAFSTGFESELEESGVATRAGITADEIIAEYQRFQRFEDDRLENVYREGQMNLRVRYAQFTGTVDFALRGEYLWKRDVGAEWVLREFLIDGVKLNWDKIPEFPFLRQEAVVQLPLDLALDKRYRYTLEGDDEVNGRPAWRLGFEPLSGDESLYKGRAYIDKQTFALARVSTIQTNLEPPMISDETTQTFSPYPGPDGTLFWILDDVDGQQIYTISGSNLVVLRKASFGEPVINRDDFDQVRDEIQQSDVQMIRETEEGFKWLSKDEEGNRVLLEEGDPTQTFILGGVLKDESISGAGVLPLAGINYTNVDAFDRDWLLNVFFAGVFANVNLSNPSLFGSKWDVGVTLNAAGFAGTDSVFRVEPGTDKLEEIEEEQVARLEQNLVLDLGYPVTSFLKFRTSLQLAYLNYQRAEDTENFLTPSDHVESSALAELSFDRRGWGLYGQGRYWNRSKWEPWGADGAILSEDEVSDAESFTTWEFGIQKSFFLKNFQQIEFGITYQGGEDLDRFSSYTFGILGGERVRGFAGSGIRYDSGILAEVEYEFSVMEAVRFDASIDYARVDEIASELTSEHYGAGFAASFPGPWQTLVRIDFGYALKSDLEEVEGDTELLLVVLKLW